MIKIKCMGPAFSCLSEKDLRRTGKDFVPPSHLRMETKPASQPGFPRLQSPGFTLIELLVVVAIILILIAIALPNFMNAMVRANVTKAKVEIRTFITALDVYFSDWGRYPPRHDKDTPPLIGSCRGSS